MAVLISTSLALMPMSPCGAFTSLAVCVYCSPAFRLTLPPRLAIWLPTCVTLALVPSLAFLTVPMAGWNVVPIDPDFLLLLDDAPSLLFSALTMLRLRPASITMS